MILSSFGLQIHATEEFYVTQVINRYSKLHTFGMDSCTATQFGSTPPPFRTDRYDNPTPYSCPPFFLNDVTPTIV